MSIYYPSNTTSKSHCPNSVSVAFKTTQTRTKTSVYQNRVKTKCLKGLDQVKTKAKAGKRLFWVTLDFP